MANHKHVVCEKPMCVSSEELHACFDYAHQQNCFLMEAHKTVFTPLNQKLFEMISNESYISHAESLISASDDRYDAHAELIDQLRVTIDAEKSVFEFLNEEEVTQDGIDEEINALNEEDVRLETLQNDLNTSTERVNELKGEIRTLIDES